MYLEGHLKSQLKNKVYYWNDYKGDRSLHPLFGHSNSNWNRQFSIEMMSKITELYIVSGDFQIPTWKDSSVLKWFQRSQNVTSFVENLIPTEKDSLILKWLQRRQKLTSFVGTFEIATEKDSLVLSWLQRSHKLTSFLGTFQIPTEKRQFSLEIISKMAESNIHCENVCFWVYHVLNHGVFRRRFERYF